MKYIVFWEFDPEDMDKVIEKQVKSLELMETNPEDFAKQILPPHAFAGQTKGVTVVEATNEQIVNGAFYWGPELEMKYVPIVSSAEIIEIYMKSKQ